MKNCEKCLASYGPYKVGKDEDVGAMWCQISTANGVTKGLCQFCNPKSKLFISKAE